MTTQLPPNIAIVILNWNGRDDTLACLMSIKKIDYHDFRVIVVDNGSSDGSVVAIRAAHPSVDIVETGANLGFSGGNNAGIKRALALGADYVLLLNNDTEVDQGLLKAFVAAARRHPEAGAMSARIYYHAEPQMIWYAGAKWSPEGSRFIQVGEGKLDTEGDFCTEGETDYACGCAFFVSAERLREIGLLDDDLFLYFEETDWCYRARAAGYPSIFVPEAKLWHKVSVSFGGENSPLAIYFVTRNRLLWAKRHLGVSHRLHVYADTIQVLARRFVLPLAGPRLRRIFTPREWWWSIRETFLDPGNRAYFLGVRDFFLRRFGNCPDMVRALAKEWASKKTQESTELPTPQKP